mgnify:CR=1 FL=1
MRRIHRRLVGLPPVAWAVLGAFFAGSIVLLFVVELQGRYRDAIIVAILLTTFVLARRAIGLAARTKVLEQKFAELERTKTQLDAALNNMPSGFCMFALTKNS